MEVESDSDDEMQQKSNAGTRKPSKDLNELLIKALAEAANPGFGDEEPEVLAAPDAPNGRDVSESSNADVAMKVDESNSDIDLKRKIEVDEKNRMIKEEEKRVAEMSFDPDALIPFSSMKERAKYIPVRLTYDERKHLRLVNAAINISDYTTAVDVAFKQKARRHHTQLQNIVAFLTGLIAATNYDRGQEVLNDRNFLAFEELIQQMLEIARRYKITNPEKMRSEYGKLVFMMQDAVSESIKPLIGVNINQSINTVYSVLERAGAVALLEDPLIGTATQEILPDKNKSRHTIQLEIKRKEKAAETIVRKYMSHRLPAESIRLCLYSVSDNNSFLNSNRRPVLECIALLKQYFSPSTMEPGYSLSIAEGSEGARLTHSHELQYHYVLQSLTLWAAILEDMFRLWYLAELDLLSEGQPYELRNTGQGLQRVQQSPRVFKAMHEILGVTQRNLGGWVGTSVIHLGDNNVPNALVFIDKYTQVARILGPLITTLNNLEKACEEDEGLDRYLKAYGGMEKAKKDILHDFFTHGFDGSGGDNFFDAGSCIDGRLTSAWNWCSQLANKPFYPLFRLTGFLSFDGQFEK